MSVPKYDKPVVLTGEEIREGIQDALEHMRGDEDKATDLEDRLYFEGGADMAETFLKWMTGQIDKEGNDVSDNSTPG